MAAAETCKQGYGQTVKRAILRSIIAAGLLSALVFGLVGCTSLSYYAQSLNGHVRIMTARQNIGKLIADPSTPKPLRDRMEEASAIRKFATDELALPDNASYRSYVDIHRDYVTWAVFAAPEFSLAPRTECFPVFGCVPYRGYFSRKAAASQAEKLERQGFDVYVSGVTAYSTLGWMSDPLLSTMFDSDETHLAGVVFHELAHQRVYVNDDSPFNEAFAVTVETNGVRKWLRANGEAEGLRRYEAARKRREEFLALVSRAKDDLQQVYDGPGTEQEKRAAKAAAIERLRARYRKTRDEKWDGYQGYDAWFEAPINNAKLAATSVYNDRVPAFEHLFKLCSGDYPRFYEAVRRIGALDENQRTTALKSAQTCG